MTQELKPGDKVTWQTPQGETTGRVKKKLTTPMEIKGHHVAASPENPEYLVESDKSGAEAAHKLDALTPVDKSSSQPSAKKATKKKSSVQKAKSKS